MENQYKQGIDIHRIWAVAWDFQQFGIWDEQTHTSLCSLLLSLETPNGVHSVA